MRRGEEKVGREVSVGQSAPSPTHSLTHSLTQMIIVAIIMIVILAIASMAICTGLLEVRCRMRFPHAAGSLCSSVGVRPW